MLGERARKLVEDGKLKEAQELILADLEARYGDHRVSPLQGDANAEGSMDDGQKQGQDNDEQAVRQHQTETTTETDTEVKVPVQPASTGEIGTEGGSESGKGESAG